MWLGEYNYIALWLPSASLTRKILFFNLINQRYRYIWYTCIRFFFYFEQIDKILQNTKETLHLTLERGASPSVSRRPTESQVDSFYLSPDDSPVSNDESLSTERIVNGVSVKIRAKRDQMKWEHFKINSYDNTNQISNIHIPDFKYLSSQVLNVLTEKFGFFWVMVL